MTTRKSSIKIDWYSFSFYIGSEPDEPRLFNGKAIGAITNLTEVLEFYLRDNTWEVAGGRRPFSFCLKHAFFTLWLNPSIDHGLVELSGQQCQKLSDEGTLIPLMKDTHEKCTRIDLACDIHVGETNRVLEFIDAGFSPRFKTTSEIVSSKGTTFYIGSRKSERMCRVYQYNPPHPRAENLRLEIELKGARAKQVAGTYVNELDLIGLFSACVNPYKFESEILANSIPIDPNETLPTITGKQSANATVFWFHSQVVPAFQRLVEAGVIDNPAMWLMETFLGETIE